MSSLVTGFQTCALPIYLTDLFTTKPKPPLAELLRPKTLDEFVGQRHLLGPGKPLRLAFEAGKLHSFILWGPPGVGKTTLGRLAASATDRSEEHTSELQSLMRISYAVFCLKQKNQQENNTALVTTI